jgi:hypothetical protein
MAARALFGSDFPQNGKEWIKVMMVLMDFTPLSV